MPTINKPFLLKLVLVVLAFSGFLFGAHALQARRIPEALKRQADRAADMGKPDAAIHYLRQYLEFEPEDVNALVQLADFIHLRSPSSRGHAELFFLYDKILRIDPNQDDIRRKALTVCLKRGRYSDAVTHSEALLIKFPNESALFQDLGDAHIGLNQLVEAKKALETAISLSPDEIRSYQRLAQLLWKNMDNAAEARTVLDRMVTAMPQEPQAYYVRARFENFLAEEGSRSGRRGDLEMAVRDLRRVLELDPENADGSLLLAEILQKGRNVPAAHTILRDAASLYPNDLRITRSLAWLELIRGNVAAAMAVLEDGLKHTNDGFDLLVPLADLLVQQGDTVRSADILKQLEARRASPLQVKYLKSRMAMRHERWTEAIALLEGLRTETLSLPGLELQINLLLATCFERVGDTDSEEKAYRRVTSNDPGNVTAHVGLATLYMNQGKFDEAVKEYELAAQSPYAPGNVVTQWVRTKASRLRLAGGSIDEWRKLEQAAVSAAAKFGPVSSDPIALRAEVAAAEGKYQEAVNLLRRETARRPGDTRLWAILATTSAEAFGTSVGLSMLDEAQAATGDSSEIRLARATLYAREPGHVRPIDPLIERIDTWADSDQLRLLYGLVEVYDQVGDRAKVVSTLRRIAARRPTDLQIWLRLHERAIEAGDAQAAAEARAGVVRAEGEKSQYVLICDAANADPQFADRLQAAFGTSPNRADACLALARLRTKAGDTSEANRLTERAFLLEPTQYETARAWVTLLYRTGEDKRAAKVVAQIATDPRWAGEAFRRMVAGVLDRVPPPAAAELVSLCKRFVERDPGGLGWLASCYTAVGKKAEADAALVAATQANTASADDWLRLASHYGATGRKDLATSTMKTAYQKLTSPLFFGLAAVFAETAGGKEWAPALKEPAEKRAFAQAQLAIKLSLSNQASAAKVLEKFLEESDVRPADASWARRNLAMLYAIGGTPDDRQRAMTLLKEIKDEDATSEELRATASVLATLARYLESDDRKVVLAEAAKALKTVYSTNHSPRDLFHLAQLYRVSGNRPESRRCLQELLNSDRENMYYLITALEELTECREFAAAEAFAGRLWSLHKGEFRALAAVARYECRAGHPERALSLAEGYASKADAAAGDYLARAARVAELLDELSRSPNVRGTDVGRKMVEAAAARYSALVSTRPEAIIGITGLLAAEGQNAEAFAKITQYDRYLSVRVRARAGLAAVRSGEATERHMTTVRKWLDDALAEDPSSVSLKLDEAEFFTIRQVYDKAVATYEEVVRRDPRNVVALNNLAWMSAGDPGTAQRALEIIGRATREAGLTGDLLDTRARARVTLKQFDLAERDLKDALAQEATALRHFHLAMLHMSKSPPKKDDAIREFREACGRGLNPKSVHPADLPVYKVLEAEANQQTKK